MGGMKEMQAKANWLTVLSIASLLLPSTPAVTMDYIY